MTFVGFFPKERPEYVVAVLLDEPKTERFAGTAACPVFREIGERLLLWDRMRRRDHVVEDEIVRLRRGTAPPDETKHRLNGEALSWR